MGKAIALDDPSTSRRNGGLTTALHMGVSAPELASYRGFPEGWSPQNMPSPNIMCPLKSLLMAMLYLKAQPLETHHLPEAWNNWGTFRLPWASGSEPT